MKPRIARDERVRRLHRLHDEVRAHEPLAVTLRRLCRAVSELLPADVVSVYLRERSRSDQDMLVMRANIGFTRVAVGNVRLQVGEGITGLAAQTGEVVTHRWGPRALRTGRRAS